MELEKHAQELVEAYGIDTEQVRAVVERPEQGLTATVVKPLHVPWGEARYALHIAEPAESHNREAGRYEVVALTDRGQEDATVWSVHVVPWSVLQDREKVDPISALSNLANAGRYGRGLSVWGHSRRFVTGKSIPPASDDGITVEDPAPCVYLEDRSERYGEDVRVSLAFAVDTEAVRADLGLD